MIADESSVEDVIHRLDQSLAKLFVWIVDLRTQINDQYPELRTLPSAGDLLSSERHAARVMEALLNKLCNYPGIWDEIAEPDIADQLPLRAVVGLRLRELFDESRANCQPSRRPEA